RFKRFPASCPWARARAGRSSAEPNQLTCCPRALPLPHRASIQKLVISTLSQIIFGRWAYLLLADETLGKPITPAHQAWLLLTRLSPADFRGRGHQLERG